MATAAVGRGAVRAGGSTRRGGAEPGPRGRRRSRRVPLLSQPELEAVSQSKFWVGPWRAIDVVVHPLLPGRRELE